IFTSSAFRSPEPWYQHTNKSPFDSSTIDDEWLCHVSSGKSSSASWNGLSAAVATIGNRIKNSVRTVALYSQRVCTRNRTRASYQENAISSAAGGSLARASVGQIRRGARRRSRARVRTSDGSDHGAARPHPEARRQRPQADAGTRRSRGPLRFPECARRIVS